MQTVLNFILQYDGFRVLSAVAYALFAAGLIKLGLIHHAAQICGEVVKQYPTGYFTFLSIQLVPLLVTGFVIGDVFVIGTRLLTLTAVAIVYVVTSSEDGMLLTKRNLIWTSVVAIIAVLLPIVWNDSEMVRNFVRDFERYIAWGSVGVMILFVFKGQFSVAKELFNHFLDGNYSVKRLNLQFLRFDGFALQTAAYWFVPSKASPIFGFDPIFVQGAIGTLGVCFVLLSALVGYIGGRSARRQNRMNLAMQRVRTV